MFPLSLGAASSLRLRWNVSFRKYAHTRLMSAVPAPALAILRCTLVCSADDTHNSYGPNRFRRQAAKDGKITLGGEGKETRDHVSADDVAELVRLVLVHRSAGLLNAVSGRSRSFAEVAHIVAATFDANGNNGAVYIFYQNAATRGTFLAPVTFPAGASPQAVRIADVNGDGLADILVANLGPGTDRTGSPGVSVLLQDAAHPGSFLPPVTYATQARAVDVAVAGQGPDPEISA